MLVGWRKRRDCYLILKLLKRRAEVVVVELMKKKICTEKSTLKYQPPAVLYLRMTWLPNLSSYTSTHSQVTIYGL